MKRTRTTFLILFPEELFEPLEWMQMLATIDTCTNETTPTKFVDEEGYDCTPLWMIRTIMHDPPHMCQNEPFLIKPIYVGTYKGGRGGERPLM